MTDLLHNYWYIAARERDVRRRPQSVTLFGQPYVVFATGHDQYGALQDRCPHRNAPLSAGVVRAGLLSCPYHGWRYNDAGECTLVPACPDRPIPPRANSNPLPIK